MRTTLRGGTLWPHGRFAFPEAFIWERSVKELQKGLQLCREKLARLEGAKPAPKDPAGGDE
ncbi:MAG: hypothetical protein FJ304_25580 [Planctomycetes bacterium]|nr:hypothetical protein [Planctomycetota bacterium]